MDEKSSPGPCLEGPSSPSLTLPECCCIQRAPSCLAAALKPSVLEESVWVYAMLFKNWSTVGKKQLCVWNSFKCPLHHPVQSKRSFSVLSSSLYIASCLITSSRIMINIKIESTKSDRLVNGCRFCAKKYFYECMHFLRSNALFIKNLSLLLLALYSVSALLLCATVQWVSKLLSSKPLEQELYGKASKSQVLTHECLPDFWSDFQIKNPKNPLLRKKSQQYHEYQKHHLVRLSS